MSTKPVSGGPQPIARANVSTQELDVEVAAAKGRVADGIDVEVFSASAKLTGDQLTVQGAMSRVEVGTGDRRHTASLETFTFKGNVSHSNPDGSVGGNAGIGANVIGVEGTATFLGASSVTGGLSVGVGAELGVGVRDFDKDGSPELCGRVSVLFFTLGACLENPF
jgi:hypothetical protein